MSLALRGWLWDDCRSRRTLPLSRRDCCVIREAASVIQWRGSPKCLHMNASEPLIYYNPIVGKPCERGDGCGSISVHASQKSSNYEGSASGAGGHLDVCLPGRVPVKRPIAPAVNPTGVWPLWSPSPEPVARVYLTGVVVQWWGSNNYQWIQEDSYKSVIGLQET